MGRQDRIKEAVMKTIEQVKREIKNAPGKKPPAYMVGFCNGLILAEHYLLGGQGSPKFLEIPGVNVRERESNSETQKDFKPGSAT